MSITKKIAVCIPSQSYVQDQAYANHLPLMFHLGKLEELWKHEERHIQYEFGLFNVGRLLTAMAREKLAEATLKEGYDYMLMFDDDMILPLDTVECMLQDMEENPHIDILAPLAFMRNAPHYPVIYTTTEGYDEVTHREYSFNEMVKKYPRNQLTECDAVGFGAVLIKVDLLKRMQPPYFFSTTGAGEDIYFCMKAKKEADARVFVDTRIKLGHLKNPEVIDEEYFDKWVKENNHDLGA